MKQGIYILSNDAYIEDAIALMNSLRRYAPRYPVRLIPYDGHHKQIGRRLKADYGVELFETRELFALYEDYALAILGRTAPMFRKFAMWSGPFDQFIFFDVDIIVFQDQSDLFQLLEDNDFIYGREWQAPEVQQVFKPQVFECAIFAPEDVDEVFNAGFFAANKAAVSQEHISSILQEAVAVRDIFNTETQEQPLINYLVLRAIPRKADLRRLRPVYADDAWAGDGNLTVIADKIYKGWGDGLIPARHLHWAGFPPGLNPLIRRPYQELWLEYRYPGRNATLRRKAEVLQWQARRLADRALSTHVSGWNRPGYQWARLCRKASDVLRNI